MCDMRLCVRICHAAFFVIAKGWKVLNALYYRTGHGFKSTMEYMQYCAPGQKYIGPVCSHIKLSPR